MLIDLFMKMTKRCTKGQWGLKMISNADRFVHEDDKVMCLKLRSSRRQMIYVVSFVDILVNSAILSHLKLCMPGHTRSYNFKHFHNECLESVKHMPQKIILDFYHILFCQRRPCKIFYFFQLIRSKTMRIKLNARVGSMRKKKMFSKTLTYIFFSAFKWCEFDSQRLQQLFGTPFRKVSLRQLIYQKSFQQLI